MVNLVVLSIVDARIGYNPSFFGKIVISNNMFQESRRGERGSGDRRLMQLEVKQFDSYDGSRQMIGQRTRTGWPYVLNPKAELPGDRDEVACHFSEQW